MSFIDETKIRAIGGKGGNGCVSFLREKYKPRGGPDGGNGGDGGDVVVLADASFSELEHLRGRRTWKAAVGGPGRGKNRHGAAGEDKVVLVPPGTLVTTEEGAVLADLKAPGDSCIASQGGRGGRGNASYASSRNRSPREADPGEPGEDVFVKLELMLLADVGIIGFPNAGKSTLLSSLSSARPEIAPYPFTTLNPKLGVVRNAEGQKFVLADIPGLIEGASEGKGLGHRFLRHISRCKALLFMVEGGEGRDPLKDLEILKEEISAYDPGLLEVPQIVALNKVDLAGGAEKGKRLEEICRQQGIGYHQISALTLQGTPELLEALFSLLGKEV